MPKVRVLPQDVIAKIAAGEVVERPASVVKELMENSLDAGASRVEVQLSSGGKVLIQVKDNGTGIAREDMEPLFFRHATSKIRSGEDLDNILSLGFRGEALYSVSSVSELTLRSRAEGSSEAWEIKVKGGARGAPVPAAMPSCGTDIRVEEIFFNTPARKKFLKSDHAEFDQVAGVFLPYALLYPDKHFVLTHNSRVIYDLPAAHNGIERAARALAIEPRHIIEVDEMSCGELKIGGILGDMNVQRPRRDMQFVFVNGRPVQSKNVVFHMNDVYRLVMPEGVQPFFAVKFEVPANEVDVNIHPAKREVRIKDEARLGSLIRRAVEQALMTKGTAKEIRTDVFTPGSGSVCKHEGVLSERIVFAPGQHREAPGFVHQTERPAAAVQAPPGKGQDLFAYSERAAVERDESLKERLSRARFLGTFIQKYHLFEAGEGLFIIDQHAAQERILFELFTRQMNGGALEVQRLLVPLVFKLSPREILTWENLRLPLEGLGFESALIGEGAVAIQAYPHLIKNPQEAFLALLTDEGKGLASRDMLARRACRASVMSGERMHADEAREQLRRLMDCADPFTCPHGRPVFIELKSSFIDKQFLRT